MAKPTNMISRFDEVGVREQLENAIYRTDPERTPLFSSMAKPRMTNTDFEYMRHAIRAANKDNAHIDGDDTTLAVRSQPSRLKTVPQIFKEGYGVTGRADVVTTAGRATESGYQEALLMIELKRDVEDSILSANPAVVGNNTTAPKSPGLGVHLYTNALHNGAGATASHTSGAPTTAVTAGTNRAFTAALLESAMQSCFEESGETPDMVVMSPSHKVAFSQFDGLAATRDSRTSSRLDESMIIAGADVYVSNFGRLSVVAHDLMAGANYVYGLKMKYNAFGVLRGFRKEKLAKTGDGEKYQILFDGGLQVRAEKPQFKIADLTP